MYFYPRLSGSYPLNMYYSPWRKGSYPLNMYYCPRRSGSYPLNMYFYPRRSGNSPRGSGNFLWRMGSYPVSEYFELRFLRTLQRACLPRYLSCSPAPWHSRTCRGCRSRRRSSPHGRAVPGSSVWDHPAAPSPRATAPESLPRSRPIRGNHEACDGPHLEALLDPPAHGRLRHPDHAGGPRATRASRPQGSTPTCSTAEARESAARWTFCDTSLGTLTDHPREVGIP